MKKTWQERLIKESDKLGKKLDSLTAFIGGDKDSPFYKLNEAERDLLVTQHSAMHVYHNILDIRMKREGLKECVDDINANNVKKGFFESFNDHIEKDIDPLVNKPGNIDKFQEPIVLGPFKSFEEMFETMEKESKRASNTYYKENKWKEIRKSY